MPPVRAVPTLSATGCLPLVPGMGPPWGTTLAMASSAVCLSVSRSNLTDMAGCGCGVTSTASSAMRAAGTGRSRSLGNAGF